MDQATVQQILHNQQLVLRGQEILNNNILISNWLAICGRLLEIAIGTLLVVQHFVLADYRKRLEALKTR